MAAITFDFDYVTVEQIRKAAMGIEEDDYTADELKIIANQFAGQLHQELGRTSQFTNGSRQWNTARVYILESCAAFIIDQYPDNSAAADRHAKRAKNALVSLRTKGKVVKTSGMNNYAE